MKNWNSAWLIFFLSLSLVGCSTMNSTVSAPNPNKSKEYIGLFSGAILGGLTGSAIGQKGGGRLTVTAIGAVVGAIAGFALGKFADDQDRDLAKVAARKNEVSPSMTRKPAQSSASWQQASNPMITMTMVQKITPVKKVVVEGKQAQLLKTPTAKKETSTIVGLWQHLPSRQWFVNDMEQV